MMPTIAARLSPESEINVPGIGIARLIDGTYDGASPMMRIDGLMRLFF